jgi:hypothetical protein
VEARFGLIRIEGRNGRRSRSVLVPERVLLHTQEFTKFAPRACEDADRRRAGSQTGRVERVGRGWTGLGGAWRYAKVAGGAVPCGRRPGRVGRMRREAPKRRQPNAGTCPRSNAASRGHLSGGRPLGPGRAPLFSPAGARKDSGAVPWRPRAFLPRRSRQSQNPRFATYPFVKGFSHALAHIL